MKKHLTTAVMIAGLSSAFAQTPYDDFAPEAQREMLGKPLPKFELINPDSCSSIKRIQFDVENNILVYYSKDNSVIEQITIQPTDYKWWSTDPAANEYPSLSPYNFVGNNPINAIDPDGKRILFVNGYWRADGLGQKIGSPVGGASYWGPGFEQSAQKFFGGVNTNNQFVEGRGSFYSSAASRYTSGYEYAKANLTVLTADMVEGETFKLVTHSQGGAYGAGIAQYLIEQGYKVETIAHLSTYQPGGFTTPAGPTTYQLGVEGDPLDYFGGINSPVKGVDKYGVLSSQDPFASSSAYPHGVTKNAGVFNSLQDLKTAESIQFPGFNTQSIPGVDNTGVFISPQSIILNSGNSVFQSVSPSSTPASTPSRPRFE